MKRLSLIIVLTTALGAGLAARAQESNAAPRLELSPPAGPEWSAFEDITKKNIFDPNRGPGRGYDQPARHITIVRAFTFRGTVDDRALFTGEGAGAGCLARGDLINGFKIMDIPVTYNDALVVLTDPGGAIINLREGESMRREDEGPWTKSDEPPPEAVASAAASTSTSSTTTTDAAPAGGSIEPVGLTGAARESEILRRLKLRREQENK